MNKGNKEKLFEKSQGLVYAVFLKYFKYYNGTQYEYDLKQEGFLELYRCVNTYDNTKGVAFSTYAFNNIYYKMLSYVDRFIKQKKPVNKRIGKGKYTQIYEVAKIFSFDTTYDIKNEGEVSEANLFNVVAYEDKNFNHAENRVLIENIIEEAKKVEKRDYKIGEVSKYLELRAKGYTFLEIQNELGVCSQAIQNRLKKFYKIYRETIAS